MVHVDRRRVILCTRRILHSVLWIVAVAAVGLDLSDVEAQSINPLYHTRIVSANDFWLTITNHSQIGAPRNPVFVFGGAVDDPEEDRRLLGIRYLPSLEYPPLSRNEYVQMINFLFGHVRGLDTVVCPSTSWIPPAPIVESTRRRGVAGYDPDATADYQFTCTFTDSSYLSTRYGYDYETFTRYRPAGVEVRQTVYAWTVPFARRFIIFDYTIRNTSTLPVARGAIGVRVWPEIQSETAWPGFSHEPRSTIGFVRTVPGLTEGTIDTINVAWVADNDGDPVGNSWGRESVRSALGIRILRTPNNEPISFNWISSNFDEWSPQGVIDHSWGPSMQGHPPHSEAGWRGLYRAMTNGEIDYDQVYSTVSFEQLGWNPPSPRRDENVRLSRGGHGDFIIGTGPIETIPPGDSVFFTFAIIMGKDFHTFAGNYQYNFDPIHPQRYLERLDWSDLTLGARWADWVYDIPGFDTDGDGDRGDAHLVNCDLGPCDTLYYRGDGVPDFRTPQPPSPPEFELTSEPYTIILRWDGGISETERDPMSGRRDFEGYRIYSGRFPLDDQMSLLSSWDVVNFTRSVYDFARRRWRQVSYPASLEYWRGLVGDPEFDPRDYPTPDLEAAFVDTVADTIRNDRGDIVDIVLHERRSYWESEDDNRGNVYTDEGAEYVNMIQRVGERDTLIGDERVTFGIYEATIRNLNPSVPLHFAVTAFDYGNYLVSLGALESSPSTNSHPGQPVYSPETVVDSNLRVSVYPNPYKVIYNDGRGDPTTYFREGYEGRGLIEFHEEDRRIHFINLPERATIRIFSLDGDLIREIHHPDPFLSSYSSTVSWDLVSRNAQAVVSGTYIWRVDSELGTQVGKLVIIK